MTVPTAPALDGVAAGALDAAAETEEVPERVAAEALEAAAEPEAAELEAAELERVAAEDCEAADEDALADLLFLLHKVRDSSRLTL